MGHYEQRITIAVPIEEVFAFHLDTNNLPRISPQELKVKILEVTPGRDGGEIGKRVVLSMTQFGLLRSTLEIEFVEAVAPVLLVDEQRRGPFRSWRQTRRFREVAGGTELHDQVDYTMPLGWLGRLVDRLVVEGRVASMFSWRQKRTRELLEGTTGE